MASLHQCSLGRTNGVCARLFIIQSKVVGRPWFTATADALILSECAYRAKLDRRRMTLFTLSILHAVRNDNYCSLSSSCAVIDFARPPHLYLHGRRMQMNTYLVTAEQINHQMQWSSNTPALIWSLFLTRQKKIARIINANEIHWINAVYL